MLIAVTGMSTALIRAQEPVTVTGRFNDNIEKLSKSDAGRLFIREQARVAVPTSFHYRSVYTLELDEESAVRAGGRVVGVVFTDNLSHMNIHRDLYGETPVTLDVYPFGRGLFYCRDYTPKDAVDARSKRWYDLMEREAARFLEHAAPGDTLKLDQKSMIDSRHTRQLIKNLSNDNPVYEEGVIHGDGVRIVRFLGIRIKKERVGFSNSYYINTTMSGIARDRLEEVFRPIYWEFDCPARGASAEEWQAWFDRLLNRGYAPAEYPGNDSERQSQGELSESVECVLTLLPNRD